MASTRLLRLRLITEECMENAQRVNTQPAYALNILTSTAEVEPSSTSGRASGLPTDHRAIIGRMPNPTPSRPDRLPSPASASRADEKVLCDRCGEEMYRMHAVWRCPRCGFKT